MSADIKTVLTKEQIEQMFLKVMGCDGGWALYEVTPGNMIQLGRAIERAVLEAAPASSAIVEQAVDARLLSDAKHALERQRVWGGTSWAYNALQPRDYLPILARINAALQSQQSPVQASDAGRQG